MTVTDNTHLEASKSLLFSVVVRMGIEGLVVQRCATNKTSTWFQSEHKKGLFYSHIHSKSALLVLYDVTNGCIYNEHQKPLYWVTMGLPFFEL